MHSPVQKILPCPIQFDEGPAIPKCYVHVKLQPLCTTVPPPDSAELLTERVEASLQVWCAETCMQYNYCKPRLKLDLPYCQKVLYHKQVKQRKSTESWIKWINNKWTSFGHTTVEIAPLFYKSYQLQIKYNHEDGSQQSRSCTTNPEICSCSIWKLTWLVVFNDIQEDKRLHSKNQMHVLKHRTGHVHKIPRASDKNIILIAEARNHSSALTAHPKIKITDK